MANVCFYFEVHQPCRLKPYSFFQIGQDHFYEDADLNYQILNKVSDRCYLPANTLLLDLIKRHEGKFKITFSITGVLLDQLEAWRPDVLESFKALAATGCAEFLAETYYHSLSFIFNEEEFEFQIKKHAARIEELFGVKPTAFRNTELIYNDKVAKVASKLGYKTVLAEGVERILKGRNVGKIYAANGTPDVKVLLRNFKLSDDIAFRFSDKDWAYYPLMAPKYASWLVEAAVDADAVNIFLDYETFGEHRGAETGIFEFLNYIPKSVLDAGLTFGTVSETANATETDVYETEEATSWADEQRDLSGWLEANMQKDALAQAFGLRQQVLAIDLPHISATWRKLLTSDHFYYMSTKYWNDGVRQAFSPYKSPYDAYINYMNVLTDFKEVLAAAILDSDTVGLNLKEVAKNAPISKISEVSTSKVPAQRPKEDQNPVAPAQKDKPTSEPKKATKKIIKK